VRKFAFAVAVVVVVSGSSQAQETIDNPEFTSWSKFKAGTSVTLKSTTEAMNVKSESTIVTKLVEVGADKLVVEMTVVSSINGMEFKAPPMKRDVPKQIVLPKGTPKPDPKDPKPKFDGKTEEGTETLKIAGGEYKAKWYKTSFEAAGNKIESKNWTSDEIPGGLLKSETTTSGANAATIKIEVTEFKKP
jgi:hypothetical protein